MTFSRTNAEKMRGGSAKLVAVELGPASHAAKEGIFGSKAL